MTPRYGIDTSVLVRLVTGDPQPDFDHCVNYLSELVTRKGAEIFVSNQVLGECYIALQHHYGISKADARAGLAQVLGSGLVSALHGREVLKVLAASSGCGLLDRLIAEDYDQAGVVTLTLDKRMATLPTCHLL